MKPSQIGPTAGVDPDLTAMINAVFAEYRDAHPPEYPASRDPELWRRLDALGLVRLTGTERSGGSGAGWPEAAVLLSAAVRHGVRIPLAEHDLLACWLLEAAGLPIGDPVRTVCLIDEHGAAAKVPWAAGADRVVLIWQRADCYRTADVSVQDPALQITPGFNMIGEPRDALVADRAVLTGVEIPSELVETLRLKSALVRAIQVCSALDRILESAIDHVASRIQFGRPLGSFQAVQNLIADIAAEAALARAATEAALVTAVDTDWSGTSLDFAIATARSCAGHAASAVVRNAHQIHGAIGTTREHRLHEFTRSALVWRSEFGSVSYWDGRITDTALRIGAPALWDLITR